jgi:Txe/YoeB family toxin of Txe-Axe toxin-antitoxin module
VYDPTSDQGFFGPDWDKHEKNPLVKHMREICDNTRHHVTIWKNDFKGSSTNPYPNLPEIATDVTAMKNNEDKLLPKSIANLLRKINRDRNYLVDHYTKLQGKAKTRLERSKKWQTDTEAVVKTKLDELKKIEADLAKAKEEREAKRIKEVTIHSHTP